MGSRLVARYRFTEGPRIDCGALLVEDDIWSQDPKSRLLWRHW